MNTVNLFIDWASEFHNPPWQACDGVPIISGESTLLDVMNEVAQYNPPVNYTSVGEGPNAYLTAIDGVQSNQGGNGYYWVFFVNGVMPEVGYGAYVLSANDSVAWDYKHYASGLRQASQADHPVNVRARLG